MGAASRSPTGAAIIPTEPSAVVPVDTDAVFLEVRDDGPGLPEEEWERIFDPYYRYHAEPSQPGSAGLGLTVARGLAQLMEGNLTYRHRNGKSIFTLRLPRAVA
ncbi:MAG TPA: ATP-binding protein [Acidimicrobiia bacterium]|nr:ATP-binding protein [Acidimicrobiia bacterium]